MSETNDLVIRDVTPTVAKEIGYGILGRSMDLHDNPDDDHEDIAIELKKIGQRIASQYSAVESFD